MAEVRRINKLFNIDIKSVDEQARTITFCFSDDKPDRQGEIVDQSTWDVKDYMNNPVILWGHDPSDNSNVLGQGISLDLNNGGKSFITAQFDDALVNPKADTIFRQLVKRTLRCVSAGFINHTFNYDNDVPVLSDNELVEVSVVAIPANPRAMALALREGTLNTKDATWLMNDMRKEADRIEAQLKEQIIEPKEGNMEQVEAQLQTVVEALGKLTEQVTTLTTQNEELKTQIEEIKPPAETEDEKTAREAKEAQDATDLAAKEAQDKADADAKAVADKEAADKAAADAAAAAGDVNEDGSAKDGSDDQSGAGTEDFDEDAELTPELQAQVDSALEEAHANQ